jgi:RNA polymerase sigma factor for flagellar operon FliA
MHTEPALDTDRKVEGDLWSDYLASRDPKLRGRVVEHYLDLAHKLAAILFSKRIHNAVRFEDYLQYARVGLLEAVDRFNPGRETSFETFASYRIRGAIFNGLEKSTEWAAQAAQRRRVRLRERAESLTAPPAADAPVREKPTDSFAALVDATILLAMGYVLEDSGDWSASSSSESADPYRTVQLDMLRRRLKLMVDALPERERQIVHYHYFEHMEFQAIAEMLAISKGRVSQLHARALGLIRDGVAALERFEVDL